MMIQFTPNDATEARSLIMQEGARHTCIVYFTKRTDGTRRRMVCRFFPEQADAVRYRFNPVERDLLPVWDVEQGAPRFVSLDTVDLVKVLTPAPRSATTSAPQPAPDREASHRSTKLQAMIDELAGFC